jgi:hypothetical protein
MGKELAISDGKGDQRLPADLRPQALPAMVIAAGEHGAYRFLDFFASNIRNPNTRAAYFHNVCEFFAWCEGRGGVRELDSPPHLGSR